MRIIAQRAAITQALINYYFGSKYGLYEAVFIRRGRLISDELLLRLEQLRAAHGTVGGRGTRFSGTHHRLA
ncbi:MAG TPA: TetR family transcriptional regulator [Alcaligenes sp.]|nr:TetR family transcriptional regulator [Alcaligenes sp.]